MKFRCLKLFYSFRFLKDGSDEFSSTKTSFPTLDANGMENELFQKNGPPT